MKKKDTTVLDDPKLKKLTTKYLKKYRKAEAIKEKTEPIKSELLEQMPVDSKVILKDGSGVLKYQPKDKAVIDPEQVKILSPDQRKKYLKTTYSFTNEGEKDYERAKTSLNNSSLKLTVKNKKLFEKLDKLVKEEKPAAAKLRVIKEW